ncbi:MAG TPA: GMC oxidoreductase, partial [Steroidobacteraceae bacterium]|nr:GMC oxidoreductase [Steroidobacteraceae bacterium]
TRLLLDSTFGGALKTQGAAPGQWYIKLGGFGEILPNHANRVALDRTRKDKWGLPLLAFDAQLGENELKMRKDMASDAAEMLEAAGFSDVRTYDREIGVGLGIHEMGTARMGKDPKTSVLNKWNQVHACPNVYVTDGSFMASSACQNPSLTYMAMTARAVDHAVAGLKGSA